MDYLNLQFEVYNLLLTYDMVLLEIIMSIKRVSIASLGLSF